MNSNLRTAALYKRFTPILSETETLALISNEKTWYHSQYFGYDLEVKGMRDSLKMLQLLRLPESLKGKSVLDVGTADGFFSFEAEARGASSVLPIDLPGGQWGNGDTIRRFSKAAKIYGSNLRVREVSFFDLENSSSFDVVFFLGVLYHLQDPFLALRRLREFTRESLYLETHVSVAQIEALDIFRGKETPMMVFYETDECNNDPSNWWSPNLSCLTAMLRAAGFKSVEVLSHDISPKSKDGRAIVRASV